MKKKIALFLFSLLLLAPLAAQNNPVDTTRQRRPPRRQFNFNAEQPPIHDPVMIKEDTTYHLFFTGMGIGHYTSNDGKTWRFAKSVFDRAPEWVQAILPEFRNHIWAPDIIYHNGQYHIFYSCSAFAKNTSAIGHAVTPTLNEASPLFGWKDTGKVVQSVPNRDSWNAIDPNIIIDEEGTAWMNFGSFWDGIKMVKLTSDLSAVAQPEEWYSLSRRNFSTDHDGNIPGSNAVEAPFIFKHGDYYYLFVSFDYCCRGMKSDYKVAVGRSQKVTGPYLDKNGKSMAKGGGTILVQGDENWAGLGHCAVYHMDGKDVFIAHGYDAKDNGQSKLIQKTLQWDGEGWPFVE